MNNSNVTKPYSERLDGGKTILRRSSLMAIHLYYIISYHVTLIHDGLLGINIGFRWFHPLSPNASAKLGGGGGRRLVILKVSPLICRQLSFARGFCFAKQSFPFPHFLRNFCSNRREKRRGNSKLTQTLISLLDDAWKGKSEGVPWAVPRVRYICKRGLGSMAWRALRRR